MYSEGIWIGTLSKAVFITPPAQPAAYALRIWA
ncbi:MAG: hypothetical protein BWX68_02465 [Verrucomicrobia bacterium ADurb.Bin063]|jgi:hypothetical protein|nr:MAG: hypothetical protein BWX68_02465 [Verrucomicrobia bacterium ADurb.Bin063]